MNPATSDDLKIGAAKPFVRNWVANHYVDRIQKAFRAEGYVPASLAIVISAAPTAAIGGAIPREAQHQETQPASVSYLSPRSESRANEEDKGLWNRMLHPQQTFDSFIPGMANQFGHGAAKSFADGQQADIPLLYIHGGFGYGKTHLLNAAALEFRKRGKRTLFLRAEDFMRHFLGAPLSQGHAGLQGRTAHRRSADHRRPATHLPQRRHRVGIPLHRECVCRPAPPSGDRRRPRATGAEGLGADVKSRLAGGLCVGLDKPDRDTRLDILKARAQEFTRHKPDVVLPEMVLERIADMEDASPRELIGVFTKLATYADLTKKPVTLETAEEAVGLRAGPGAKTSIEDIQRKTGGVLQARRERTSIRLSAPAASPVRARSPCTCRAS